MRPEPWEDQSRCKQLTPEQADALFFPSHGGKPNKANTFCGGCPVESLCIERAVQNNLDGFWAGTTREQRTAMRTFTVASVAFALPPEPPARRVLRKVFSPEDVHSWLDQDFEPSPLDILFDEVG